MEPAQIERSPGAPSSPIGAVQPDPRDTVFCFYEDSVDGFTAIWALRKLAQIKQVPVEFTTGFEESDKLTSRNVIVVGSDVVADDAKQFIARGAKSVLLITRTESDAKWGLPVPQWKRSFPYGIETLAQAPQTVGKIVGSSLSAAAWDYAFGDRKGFDRVPRLVDQVQDYASGANKYADSASVTALIETYEKTFRNWDALAEALDNKQKRGMVVAAGQAVVRARTPIPSENRLKTLLAELRAKKG